MLHIQYTPVPPSHLCFMWTISKSRKTETSREVNSNVSWISSDYFLLHFESLSLSLCGWITCIALCIAHIGVHQMQLGRISNLTKWTERGEKRGERTGKSKCKKNWLRSWWCVRLLIVFILFFSILFFSFLNSLSISMQQTRGQMHMRNCCMKIVKEAAAQNKWKIISANRSRMTVHSAQRHFGIKYKM